MTPVLRGLYVMSSDVFDDVYGPAEREAIGKYVTIDHALQDAESILAEPRLLEDIDVLFSSWGCPSLDAQLLANAPRLRALFYAAGSVQRVVSPALWERPITVVSAKQVIAECVADFTVSLIMLSLKHFWPHAFQVRAERRWVKRRAIPGTIDATVGVVSLGSVGGLVAGRLVGSGTLRVVASDPYATADTVAQAGCELVDLGELFEISDVVTVHAPLLPETTGMISEELLGSLKPGATLINTARGPVIDPDALIAVLRDRPDLTAVLDVTEPEPPPADSPLYTLPNVVLTPHIAGNLGRERRALGRAMVDQLERWVSGEPLNLAVQPESLTHGA